MPIYADGAVITGNGQGGVLVVGDDVVSLRGAIITGNGGVGLEQRSASLVEQLGFPSETDPRDLAEFLILINSTPPDERAAVAQQSRFLAKLRTFGLAATAFTNNVLSIASNPAIIGWIKQLSS